MGLIFNGNGDVIKAVDGSLTIQGLDFEGGGNVNAGIGTFSGNLNVGGVLTYEDVKNVDSVGIISARQSIHVGYGVSAAGIITATSFRGDGSQLTSLPAQATIANNADNRVITGGSGVNLNGEANLTFDGTNLNLVDEKSVYFGTGNDLRIWHNASGGNHSYIMNHGAGVLKIGSDTQFLIGKTGNETYIECNPDGNVELYHDNAKKLETTADGIEVTGKIFPSSHIDMADNVKLLIGTGDDLEVFHDGSNSYIKDVGTGDLNIAGSIVRLQSSGGETLCRGVEDGAFELYHNNIKKLETASWGVDITGDCRATELKLEDGNYLSIGSGNDLRLRHDGTNSTIVNSTGSLKILGSEIKFMNAAGNQNGLIYTQAGSVELYHNNNKKVETTSSGVTVTGTVAATAFTGDGSGLTGAGPSLANGSNDRVVTATGANALTGETNLTYSSSFLLKNTTATSSNNTEILRLENTHSDGKMTVLGFRTTGLGSPQTKIYGGNDNTGANGQGGDSGAGKFKVTITNPSGMHQEVIYAENDANSASKFVRFSTDGTERMRIRSDGEIVMGLQAGVAYDTDTLFVNGPSSSGRPTMEVHGNGNNSPSANSSALHIKQNCTNAPDTAAALKITHTNPLAGQEGALITCYSNINNSNAQRSYGFFSTGRIIQNRPNNDGTLISFRHNNTSEGSISISGGSVSYNGGVLTRWSQFVGLSTTSKEDRPTIYQGTVLSNLDEMCEWTGEDNQQLNKTKVSDTVGDKNVAGVFWTWDEEDDETGYVNEFYVAMTGDMVIRVAGSISVARGDLLESAGDGTAKPQSDDIVRSKTIAKIISTTSTATYADGSKAYPCVLMAC